MRVLFSSTSGFGHLYPMVPLARAFRAAGHDVLWAVAEESRAPVEACGIPTTGCGPTGPSLGAARRAVLGAAEQVAPAGRAAFVFPRMFGEAFTGPMAGDLLPLAREWGPDLLVHEQGELASPLVGAVLGVPSVTVAFGGAVPAPILRDAGEHVAPVWAAHGLEVPPYAGCFEHLYLDICPPSVAAVPTDHVVRTQPLRPVADTGPAPDPVPGHLTAAGDPLVFVTLGTVRNDGAVLRRIVEAVAGLPVRVLVTVGPSTDAGVLGGQPGHVRVEEWVHQPQVLEHCALVVSHGGSGTFLGALAQGLPQLCLPQAADQFRNAEGGARRGAALVLGPAEADPDAVRSAVSRLLGEPEFGVAARDVAAEIAAMPSPAEVVEVLVGRWGRPAALR